MEALEAGRPDPIPGCTALGQPAGPHIARPTLPRPSRAALPALKTYARLEHDGHQLPVGYVEASRGCKHLCRHCPIPPVYGGASSWCPRTWSWRTWRSRWRPAPGTSPSAIPTSSTGPGTRSEVARRLHRDFPAVTYDFTAKIEHLLRRAGDLPELAALGCALRGVRGGVAERRPCSRISTRGTTRADVEVALSATRAAGIALRPTWVAFTPWTTLGDFVEVLDWVAAPISMDHVDPVQYSLRLLVPPGSLLVDHPGMRALSGRLGPGAISPTSGDTRTRGWRRCRPEWRPSLPNRPRGPKDRRRHASHRVRALAARAAGTPAPEPLAPGLIPRPAAPPRLTEPWFC